MERERHPLMGDVRMIGLHRSRPQPLQGIADLFWVEEMGRRGLRPPHTGGRIRGRWVPSGPTVRILKPHVFDGLFYGRRYLLV